MQFVKHEKLNDDLFLVALEDSDYLLYAPLRKRALKVDAAFASEIRENTENAKIILDRNGFNHSQWQFPSAPRTDYKYSTYIPASLMISVTSRCNLRCAYCFADGGDYNDVMSWDVAKAILEFIPIAAKRNGNQYNVSFHGDGETLMVPDLVYKFCDELRKIVSIHGTKIWVSLTTNATLINESNIQKIKENFHHLGVSFDGDDIAQGTNRPLPNGESSFPALLNAVRLLKENNVSFGFRATVTRDSVKRMPDMIDFVVDVLNCPNIHFEPATSCNRAGESMTPPADEFIHYYTLAKARAKERNVQIFTSMARPDNQSQTFCGTPNAGMTILADGTVTSCSRVTHPADPFYKDYVFGKFNPVSKTFEFDDSKVVELKTTKIVTAYPECNDCFARWHCAGICPVNRSRGSAPFLCEITQHLTLDGIMDKYYAKQFINQQEMIKALNPPAEPAPQPSEQAPMNAQETV